MATTIVNNVVSGAISKDLDLFKPPIPPDPPDTLNLNTSNQPISLTTLDDVNGPIPENRPLHESRTRKLNNIERNLNILHIEDIPNGSNYETINETFCRFGIIKEIRMDFNLKSWEAWISFENHEAALEACKSVIGIRIKDCEIKGALCDKVPKNLDIYKPEDWTEKSNISKKPASRVPKPPSWFIAKGKGENSNYFRMSRFIQKKVGNISSKDISRFSNQCVLIHAKSDVQAYMLSNMDLNNDGMLEYIKPHHNFSYGKGVIFDKDLYDFSEQEILEMCPPNIWKVNKIPRTKMIIVTYDTPDVPMHVFIENERLHVREFRPRPLQCFNCYRFGHPSGTCRNRKTCLNCAANEHGQCSNDTLCVNCKGNHMANSKDCPEYGKETSALLKANAEHISVGYAKKLLGHQRNYAEAAKALPSNISNANPNMPSKSTDSTSKIKPQGATSKIKSTASEINKNNKDGECSMNNDDLDFQILPDLAMSPQKQPSSRTSKPMNNRKRERQPSSSPLTSPKPHNRFEILDADTDMDEDIDLNKNEKPKIQKITAELHNQHPARQQNETKSNTRPNIQRNPSSNNSQKKRDATQKHKIK